MAAAGGCSPPCPCAGMGLGGRVAEGSAEGGASWLLGRGAPSSFHPLPPQGPPNFLRASALAEHIKPVVVIPEEAPEDEEPENLIEISTGPPAGEPAVSGAPSLPPPSVSWGSGAELTEQALLPVAGGGRPLRADLWTPQWLHEGRQVRAWGAHCSAGRWGWGTTAFREM